MNNEWREIIKAKGKLSTKPSTKPSVGTSIKTKLKPIPQPSESNCNKKLEEYANMLERKISAVSMWDNVWNYSARLSRKTSGVEDEWFERIIYDYHPIPEEVACKALEYFNAAAHTEDVNWRTVKDKTDELWYVGWRVDKVWDNSMGQSDAGVTLIISNADIGGSGYSKIRWHNGGGGTFVHLSHRVIIDNGSQLDEKEILSKIDWR
tara:strand:- start:890 stop:1510 length:621 start_codon:yes stop_codon:yes gene_type:complete